MSDVPVSYGPANFPFVCTWCGQRFRTKEWRQPRGDPELVRGMLQNQPNGPSDLAYHWFVSPTCFANRFVSSPLQKPEPDPLEELLVDMPTLRVVE